MNAIRSTIIFCLFFLISGLAMAASEDDAAIKKTLSHVIPGQQPDSIVETPISGLYEVIYGSEILYVTGDGRFLIQGDLVDMQKKVNLTEEKRSQGRMALLESIDAATAITFAPDKTRYVVYVFTDVDCPYCRKMHKGIEAYKKLGIEIRYLAYPRSGVNTESYFKMVSVWCAEDRQAAMTKAKSGTRMPRSNCENPVLDHMAKAGQIGLTGTPTLLLPDGTVIPGYVPPDQLIRVLDERIGKASPRIPLAPPVTDTPAH